MAFPWCLMIVLFSCSMSVPMFFCVYIPVQIFKQVPDGVTDISRSKVTNSKPAVPPIKPTNHMSQAPSRTTNHASSAPASTTTTPTAPHQPSSLHNSANAVPHPHHGSATPLQGEPPPSQHVRKGSTTSITSGGATTPNSAPYSYSNLTSMTNHSGGQTYAQVRAKLRPTGGFYAQFSPGKFDGIGPTNARWSGASPSCFSIIKDSDFMLGESGQDIHRQLVKCSVKIYGCFLEGLSHYLLT